MIEYFNQVRYDVAYNFVNSTSRHDRGWSRVSQYTGKNRSYINILIPQRLSMMLRAYPSC